MPTRTHSQIPPAGRVERGEKRDVRQEVTDRLIQSLQEGRAPWQRPYEVGEGYGLAPVNAVTGKAYNGGNALFLAAIQPTADPRWVTYKQAQEQGRQVKKGEHGVPIEVWKTYEKKETIEFGKLDPRDVKILKERGVRDGQSVTRQAKFAKYYTAFHVSQIDGFPPLDTDPSKKHEFDLDKMGEKLIERTPNSAELHFDNPKIPHYSPGTDSIHLPGREYFKDAGHLYATAAHEIAHSTMHPDRLNRPDGMGNQFGSPEYAREELRAEMASYMLALKTGLPHHPENHASYVGGWIQALKGDKNEIYRAARDAERIADWVIAEKRLEVAQSVERTQEGVALKERQAPAKTPVVPPRSAKREKATGRGVEL